MKNRKKRNLIPIKTSLGSLAGSVKGKKDYLLLACVYKIGMIKRHDETIYIRGFIP